MKHILAALAFCAAPATAFAQSVSCQSCDHVASYFRGAGGFIGTVADGVDEVAFVASCGGVTVTGPAQIHGETASQLFSDRNGLACEQEGGSLEIAGLKDGGWYWIHDDLNSAVGNLVAKDILRNEKVDITPAGPSITMTEGDGAVFLKHSGGRVGILPNILPEPPDPAATTCGPRVTPNTNPPAYTSQMAKSCMLGDGGTKVRVTGPIGHGRRGHLTSSLVTRPATGDALELDVDLWVDESGSYNTGDLAGTPALANRGWAGKGTDNWLGNVGWFAGLSGAGPGTDLAGAAITIADDDSNGQATISISPSATYCPSAGTQYTASVNVLAFGSGATVPDTVHGGGTATTGSSDADTIFPPLATQRSLGGAYSSTTIRVACPPQAAANLGQEPVPENPSPTDR